MKKWFILSAALLFLSVLNAAEIFYSDGTSIPMKKSEEITAIKSSAKDAANQKGVIYRMSTGKDVYSFVSGQKKGGLPVYFLGDEPVVAEMTVLWRGDKPVEYMEQKYGMKLTEIFQVYPLYAFSVQGDSVEIAEKIVKNGDGYAFADILRETQLHFVPESTPQDPYLGVQWHLHNTGKAPYSYSNAILSGDIPENVDIKFLQALKFLYSNGIEADTNTKIAIMDTGVAPHDDLTKRDEGFDAIKDKDGAYPDEKSSEDDHVDHGTKCAGISAATGNTIGMSGVCPWCGIYPVKWLTGLSGSTSAPTTSMMLTVYEKYINDPNITTINCSFGPLPSNGIAHVYPDAIEAILGFMRDGRNGKGGVVVYSSGNDTVDSSYQRLLEYDFKFERDGVQVTDRVVTVNASTAWDTLAEYSNFGYATTVAAPSLTARPQVGIATTAIPGDGEYPPVEGGTWPVPSTDADYTVKFSGTSAAAPVVSGLFGVLFSINPDLTLEEAIDILKRSADKINPDTGLWDENGFSVKYGYGRVNLEKAVRLAAEFPMCETITDEICNHIDDDCDGYVDEECSDDNNKLTTGNPCDNDEQCRQPGSSTLDDVKCITNRLSWVFKDGYCFSKTFIKNNTNGRPCPDGTKLFDKEKEQNSTYFLCALECNSTHPCERPGYYCTDEILGVCLPLCSSNSDCANGATCNENHHCVQQCGNGTLDEGEVCDYGENNDNMNCAYGETSCKACINSCTKEINGKTSYCGDYLTDPLYGEVCDYGYYNGRTNCAYGKTSCTVCTSDCKEATGITSYCGDSRTDSSNGEKCDAGANNGTITDCAYGEHSCTVCTAECKTAAGITSYCGDGSIDTDNGEICDEGEMNGEIGHCNGTCSGIVEIPETPDEGDTVPDEGDTTPDEGDTTPDEGDTTPDEGDTTQDEGDTTQDEGDTTQDEGDTTSDNGGISDEGSVSSDEDPAKTDSGAEEPASEDNTETDTNNKKSDGCSVLIL